MDYQSISKTIEDRISLLFDELRSGIAEREDSRAFGAMVERKLPGIGISSVKTLAMNQSKSLEEGLFLTLPAELTISYLALM
ncbi:MAG: hypothetical protein HYZ16_01600 [Bacteroidetes bacterium]|jgi:hypothetical protein|nr:hypothetical protein [Bacteroidota bacterium]